VFSSVVVLFNLMPQPEQKGDVKVFMDGVMATHYLLTFIKITELVCGILFLIGRFVPLATVMIFPIVLNIFLFHVFVDRQGLVVGILLLAANLFLAWYYRKNYAPMLVPK
jgi:uncharacterized membrane protein YphA (DoxX/SURF4 family)